MKSFPIMTIIVCFFFTGELYSKDISSSKEESINNSPFIVRWELQVTDPEFELKYYKLDDASYKAFLPKTSWRCTTTQTHKRGQIELKKLTCNYSIEKTGTVTTTVSCSPQRPYSEVVLELYDERKNLPFHVMLNCRKQ